MKKVTLSTALAWLSGKKDRDELMESFLQISSQILRTHKSQLFSLYSKTGEKEFSSFNLEDVRVCDATGKTFGSYFLDVNENMLKCVSLQKPILSINKKEGKEELYYPIRGQKGVIQVLYFLSNGTMDREIFHSLSYLTAIYRDHFILLQKSEMDHLTGLSNRYAFSRDMNKFIIMKAMNAMNAAAAHQFLAVMDIDHFKRINDTFGHVVGDEVLLQFARLMEGHFCESGKTYRYGGEEFSLVYDALDHEDALNKLDQFRESVLDYRFPNVGRVSVSIGLTELTANDIYLEVIERADRALYYGKANGRNQVHTYEVLLSSELVDPMIQESEVVLWKP
ncbi:MAG: GGDEF domain-containing protein [Spirochaetia bacterium]|nr:GGDEF domain-containing protein [Spirochaetia bacterium]